jgi:hypothetical protein
MKFDFKPEFYNFEHGMRDLGFLLVVTILSLLQLTQFTSRTRLLSI